jgi:hypothetical protein
MAKFDQLVTIAEWAHALDLLLKRAADTATKVGGANETQKDLFETDVGRRIAAIASRKGELQLATKALNSVTEDLGKSESDLKFEKIIETLEVSAGLIQELKNVRGDLDAEDKSILDRALAIADTVDEIRTLVRQYRVTDKTLQALSAIGIDDPTVKKLRAIVGRRIRGEQRFLQLVKSHVGSDAVFDTLADAVLAHATA